MRWFLTGCAGFIGSHILETLLKRGDAVIGIDDFSTGFERNLQLVEKEVGSSGWSKFAFTRGSILDQKLCESLCQGVDVVCHQAALGSVPRSIQDPLTTNRVNVEGTLNIFSAAQKNKVKRVVYASSSSVYGDSNELPKKESIIGNPLSPYAASKRTNELYASAFGHAYGMHMVGLRYFNVFGPRQNPDGDYAAVIPRWIDARLKGQRCTIFGDGLTSRDFCYVSNVVQACLKAAEAPKSACGRAYNIAVGGNTTLRQLYDLIEAHVHPGKAALEPELAPFRTGDVRHSHADISLAKQQIGFSPSIPVAEGLAKTIEWYRKN